jgi:thioredoxin reductase (NADPH)
MAEASNRPAEPSAPNLTPDPWLAPRLTDEQVALLHRFGEVQATEAGQVLFREGDRSYDFIVILTGTVTVMDHQAGVARELSTGDSGQFVAELNILTGERVFTTAVVSEPGSILIVPADRLHEVLAQDQALADVILLAGLARRRWLAREHAGMRIVGSGSSLDVRRLREFAARNRLPNVWVDVETNPVAGAILRHHRLTEEDTPIVVIRGGEVLRNPSNTELAHAAGFGTAVVPGKVFDVAVIGAGPAGLAASVYGASEGLTTVTVDGMGVGGQIGTTSRIENYLGFPVGITGEEFAERALVQVLRFGATLLVPCTAVGLAARSEGYAIRLADGEELAARTVIVASGVTYRRLEGAGLDEFEGAGVFYTPLAAQDRVSPGDRVVIVGGGNSAGQAATWLADHGHPVTVVIRGDSLAQSMSSYLIERITAHPGVTVIPRSMLRQLGGDRQLERVVIEEVAAPARRQTLAASALFVLIGAEPHTHWLAGAVQLDSNGFVVTGPTLSRELTQGLAWDQLGRDPYLLETSLPGVYAAGDVRSGSVKRVASAVGEGSIAIRFVSEHLGRRGGAADANRPVGPAVAPARSAGGEPTVRPLT